jgi:hypothetical protein
MEDNEVFTEVSTLAEIKEHLDNGEFIFFSLSDAQCYMSKQDNEYLTTIQPTHGAAKVWQGSEQSFNNTTSHMLLNGYKFYIAPDIKVLKGSMSLLDRIVEFFRRCKEKKEK